ncbi:hypothetical protein [Enterococcus dongliensis]|uniref:hypothetical protein n=1 Tax=Enterococcus dongliensis TaxID=2559925 RepID=UPI00288D0A55|nr:hypothetical protein [Enterococcus dongliensis]MDT2613203.1 hypothetical protein [Enterococcus dongliensis]
MSKIKSLFYSKNKKRTTYFSRGNNSIKIKIVEEMVNLIYFEDKCMQEYFQSIEEMETLDLDLMISKNKTAISQAKKKNKIFIVCYIFIFFLFFFCFNNIFSDIRFLLLYIFIFIVGMLIGCSSYTRAMNSELIKYEVLSYLKAANYDR